MRAIHNYAYIEPAGALALVDIPEPPLPVGQQVLIGMEYAPITMTDLSVLSGKLLLKRALPSVAGSEGVGRVLATGDDVRTVKVGDRVLLPSYGCTWSERLLISSIGLFPLPADADPRQLAMLLVHTSISMKSPQFQRGYEVTVKGLKITAQLIACGKLKMAEAEVYPLCAIQDAIVRALSYRRVLLDICSPLPKLASA